MGVVLLADDESLERRVAIKFIRPNLAGPSFRRRFLDEARAMARVNHPNVLQVHAFGEHGAAPYFVTEFVEGSTLEQWLAARRSPHDLDVALRILNDVCLGVAAIHAQDTVHHDIKPANILLDEQLRPRVADLGLANRYQGDSSSMFGVVGTPAYMAPEIAFSRDRDPALRSRADVYSLACVAYELLTGHPPFDGSGNGGLLLQHAMRPVPPPSNRCVRVPKELDHAVLRALEKDPRARTPSILGVSSRPCRRASRKPRARADSSRRRQRLFSTCPATLLGHGVSEYGARVRRRRPVGTRGFRAKGSLGRHFGFADAWNRRNTSHQAVPGARHVGGDAYPRSHGVRRPERMAATRSVGRRSTLGETSDWG